MADYFRKTERGRREVRERSLNLSRSARNLLLILDSSKSLGDWIAMIHGATPADGVALLEAGLIEAQAGPGGADTHPAMFEPTEPMGHDSWQIDSAIGSPRPAAARGGAGFNTRPSTLSPPQAPATTRPGLLGPDDAGPTTRPPHRQAHVSAPTRMAPSHPPSADAAPSSLLPEDTAGFVPLDTGGLPAGGTGLGYTELYDSLNALLRETLGLFRGYRYTLRIEKAQNITELEAVAREFVAEVKRLRGDSMGRMVQRALGLGG